LHNVVPAGHVHTFAALQTPGVVHVQLAQRPPAHAVPAAHRAPQPPQSLGSFDVFTHAVPHIVSPGAQPIGMHAPALHRMPIAHTVPHAPQFAGSFERLTHAPPHRVCPVGHAHTPALHGCPPQLVKHVPQ
jgi:hypothetical protein